MLNFYKEVIRFRNAELTLQRGAVRIDEELSSCKVFAFYREFEREKFLIVMNFSGRSTRLDKDYGNVELSTYSETDGFNLKPFEGRIYRL